MAYDVFISYRRKTGADDARLLQQALKARGYNVFFDYESLRDGKFDERIFAAIEEAPVFILMLSEGALDNCVNENDWVRIEIEHALEKKRKIIPVAQSPQTWHYPDNFPGKLTLVMCEQISELNKFALFEESIDALVRDRFPSALKKSGHEQKDVATLGPSKEWPVSPTISGDRYRVNVNGFVFDMMRVDGGKMQIGATQEQGEEAENNEYPAHEINLSTFYIGQFPVTQNLWELVMGYSKSHFKENDHAFKIPSGTTLGARATGGASGAAIGAVVGPVMGCGDGRSHNEVVSDLGHCPAENLTHDEACEFVGRLSGMTNIQFDLPTEEEWEYAARGGQKSKGSKYAGSNEIEDVAWFRRNSVGSTHPVGKKKPNELGIYDMSGNVWEWTSTPAHPYGLNIVAGGNVFIRRGGSWWHDAASCRVSKRYASDRSKKTSGLGLRLVIRENIE